METVNSGPKYLTEAELAERLGVAPGSLANQRNQKRGIPFHKFGRNVRYDLADVEAYESACRVDTFPEHGPPV